MDLLALDERAARHGIDQRCGRAHERIPSAFVTLRQRLQVDLVELRHARILSWLSALQFNRVCGEIRPRYSPC